MKLRIHEPSLKDQHGHDPAHTAPIERGLTTIGATMPSSFRVPIAAIQRQVTFCTVPDMREFFASRREKFGNSTTRS